MLPACQACWYYYTIATHQKEKVGKSTEDQIILEGEPWQDTHYAAQKLSVAFLYGLKDPAEMDKFWRNVELCAAWLGLPEPADEIKLLQRIVIN